MRFFEIIDQILGYYPRADVSFIEKAYVFAAKYHKGQVRLRGEPYLNHPLAVAGILAGMRLDEASIAAGLLHDCLEEKLLTPGDLEEAFGASVARIVEGVTKLGQLDFSQREERQAEYMRKMILTMSEDIRVVLVKLADRLQEMRSFKHHVSAMQEALAEETLHIYAPLAARLGIDWMKQELEDLSFQCLHPDDYREIFQGLAKTEEDRKRYVEEVKQIILAKLRENDLSGRISGRSKHLFSIYQKMMRQNLDLQRVYDVIAFRIILDSVKSCYEALGIVHSLWEPVEGRYKDYIVKPKANMYQSLHTTVMGPYGERMEVQIRTEEMDMVADEGIAAHWLYKEGKPTAGLNEEETRRFSWLRELLEWNREWRDPKGIFEAVKVNLYPDEVYVFTPEGEVKALAKGATPVDFAYEVHSEVGHRCVGARVNGKLVTLRHELQNGDTIEILTAANHHPSKDWLKFVKSTKARNRIRHWIKAEERENSIAVGRELCEKEFRKRGLNFNNYINSSELQEAAKSFSLRSIDDLLASVGYYKVSPVQVFGKMPVALTEEQPAKEESIPLEKRKSSKSDEGVRVRGVDDVLMRMAKCCNPLPGEPIVGFITRGRGITVHRDTCKNIEKIESERKIEVQWDSGEDNVYPVDIKVAYSNNKGMLAALSGVLGQLDASVVDVHVESEGAGSNLCRMKIEVKDTGHLQRVLSALRAEKGVYSVQRSAD